MPKKARSKRTRLKGVSLWMDRDMKQYKKWEPGTPCPECGDTSGTCEHICVQCDAICLRTCPCGYCDDCCADFCEDRHEANEDRHEAKQVAMSPQVTLQPVDLSLLRDCEHPDIKENVPYLAKIEGEYLAGHFAREWYGWNYDAGDMHLELDESFEYLWEIIENEKETPTKEKRKHLRKTTARRPARRDRRSAGANGKARKGNSRPKQPPLRPGAGAHK